MDSMSITTFLNSLPKNEPIYYRSNPGNAGDALIACGAFLLFDQLGMDVHLVDPANFDGAGKIVIYAGGGNLVGYYSECRDFMFKHHKTAKQLVLLPHTVTGNEDLLSEFGDNVTLFAREQNTFEHLQSHAKNARALLADDLAFYINPEEIINSYKINILSCILKKIFFKLVKNKTEFSKLPQPKIMLRNSIFEMKNIFTSKKSGNFFRTDVERSLEVIPDVNADLSRMYEYGTRNKEICFYTTARLMRFINLFDEINTDRLHICIAGALLGKKVNFFPNSYFKCKAVYEKSLKGKYSNVNWNPKQDPGK